MIACIYTPRTMQRGRSRLGTKTRLAVAAAILSLIALLVRAQLAEAANVTLFGKILDMSCYTAQESDSRVYRACARSSPANRSPAGLLAADGKVYLLMSNPANAARRAQFGDKSLVRVTGKLIRRGGLLILAVSALRKA